MALDERTIDKVFAGALADGRETLLEHEVYSILTAAGLNVPKHAYFSTPEEVTEESLAKIPGDYVVVKVISPQIPHKTEFYGVQVIPRGASAVRVIFDEFIERAEQLGVGPVGALVCEKISLEKGPGTELLFSIKMDRAFGPAVAFGLGGILTEYWGKNLRGDRSMAVRATSGLDRESITEMVDSTVAADFLEGRVRGQDRPLVKPGQVEEVVQAFIGLGRSFCPCGQTNWTIEELEVNPVAVDRAGRLVALDGVGRFSRVKLKDKPRPLAVLKSLLEPKTVLLSGVSGKTLNPGRVILRNLLTSPRYNKDNVYILHPQEKEIEGVPCVTTLDDLPDGIDMAVITMPASEGMVKLLANLAAGGKVKTFTLITSGFGETAAGQDLQDKLETVIRVTREREDGGVLVNGPNCLGIISAPGDYNTFFLPTYKLPIHKDKTGGANLASVSQSGAFLVSQISRIGRFITPRYSISFGNQIDISVADYVDYLAGDAAVDVISVYVEGFQTYGGERLLNAGRRARDAGKTLIIYKTGRTEAGAQAASSHTAAIVGNYGLVKQCFQHMGALVAPDLETFEEWTQVFTLLGKKKVTGQRVGVITNAGFETTVGSDRLGCLELADFGEETWERMRAGLPGGIIDFRNPVDTSPQCDTEGFLGCVQSMVADPAVDCLLVSAVPCTPALENLPPGDEHQEDLYGKTSFAHRLIRIFKGTSKPLVTVVDAGEIYEPLVNLLQDHGIPTFRKIDRAMMSLSAYVDHHGD